MDDLRNRNTFLVFTLLLFFVACQDGENSARPDPDPPEPVAAEPVDVSPPEALFTDAATVAGGNQSRVIINQLIELVDAVPKDGSVYISIYLFEYEPLVRALERAHSRNVSLHVMMDRSSRSNNTATAGELSQLGEHVEIVHIYNNASGSAINHNKFVLFPEITTREGILENVIFQTSQNFKESGNRKIQDGVILADENLYRAYLDYWQDMKALANEQMDEFEYREYEDSSVGITAYFHPKRKNGGPHGGDTVIEILDQIDDPASATVKVGMSAWTDSRYEVLHKLEELLAEGAELEVVTKSSIGPETYSGLRDLTENGAIVKIFNMESNDPQKINIHSKFMMIDGLWNGEQRKLLMTGTQNFTMNALRNNNETTLLFRDHEFYDLYEAYFETLKTLPGVCCTAESMAKVTIR